MTWPPNNQPTGGKSDSTPMATDHPTEHNAIKDTLDDIIEENAGALPLDGGGTVKGEVRVTENITIVSYAQRGLVLDRTANANVQGLVELKPSYDAGATTADLKVDGNAVARFRGDKLTRLYGDAKVDGVIRASDGTRSAPSITFHSDDDTGIHRVQTDVIELVVGGQRAAQFGASDQGAKAGAWIPGISYRTTLNTPNVWIHTDAAQEGALFRSTASRAVMAEVETVSLDATDQVGELRPLWFRSTATGDDPALSHYGLAAEDVAELDPRLATYITDDDGNTRPDDVNYRAITALLVSEVQRQRAQLAALEARLAALEA